MKKNIFNTLILSLIVTASSVQAGERLYQVMTSHPHDVEQFQDHITTVKQDGRLWLVNLKPSMPFLLRRFFKPADLTRLGSYMPEVAINAKQEMPFKDLVETSEVENIKSHVMTLSSYKTRYAGTSENKDAGLWIEKKFQEMGYVTKQLCYQANTCSILAEKKGAAEFAQDVILVEAHFDSVGKNFAGADDNASGAASLLEIARVLSTAPTKKTIRFLATNGEELGLYGAKHYATLLANEGTIKNLKLVINMDMVGYNSNGIVELETNKEYEGLANWFAKLAAEYTKLKSKITLGAWGSDHVPFLEKAVPTLLTIEDWSTKTPCYHKECDKPETLNYNYANEITKLNIAAVLTKDAE